MSNHWFERSIPALDYNLDATMLSGQVFGWRRGEAGWQGVVGHNFVAVSSVPAGLRARTPNPPGDWAWLSQFLQVEVELETILSSFPSGDEPLQLAAETCRGLRLLRQDPWECLASFILSSTKQIVQIQQVHRKLCERFGPPIVDPDGRVLAHAFPSSARLAQASESDLRACKMGFRAPYLLAAARQIHEGSIDLGRIQGMDLAGARMELMRFAGVGEKIADCVLLFAYGFPGAFPIDVWVERVLHRHYPGPRKMPRRAWRGWIENHFGPNAGYAQQYLFHHARMTDGKKLSPGPADS